jgi:cysteine desulfurase family protein (TIGR01976 family)
VKVWRARWPEGRLEPAELRALLTPRTRLVAVTAAANSVGTAPDVAAAAELARAVGAWSIVDAVHASPHQLPDAKGWGADFVVFSPYKVFGPHLGCLYVRGELLPRLPADKLWFVPEDSPQKFEPGTANHEGLAGWLGTLRYVREVLGEGQPGRAGLEAAWRQIEALERPLVESALERLRGHRRVRLHGIPEAEGRVGTFCLSVPGVAPRAVAEHLAAHGVGVAAGHYYAPLAMEALGLMPEGAVRVSLAHYNTAEDLARLFSGLDALP